MPKPAQFFRLFLLCLPLSLVPILGCAPGIGTWGDKGHSWDWPSGGREEAEESDGDDEDSADPGWDPNLALSTVYATTLDGVTYAACSRLQADWDVPTDGESIRLSLKDTTTTTDYSVVVPAADGAYVFSDLKSQTTYALAIALCDDAACTSTARMITWAKISMRPPLVIAAPRRTTTPMGAARPPSKSAPKMTPRSPMQR